MFDKQNDIVRELLETTTVCDGVLNIMVDSVNLNIPDKLNNTPDFKEKFIKAKRDALKAEYISTNTWFGDLTDKALKRVASLLQASQQKLLAMAQTQAHMQDQ